MKDLIKQILREETSGLKPALIKAFYSFMESELEGYEIYTDTSENRFYYTPESIWFINPKTKKWMLQLEKSGELRYYDKLYDNFSMWFKEEQSVFEQLITMWVEDVIKNGVSTTGNVNQHQRRAVEDVIKNGVSTTISTTWRRNSRVEDVLKNGIKLQ